MFSGTAGESESRCSEQHGIRSKRKNTESGVRLRRCNQSTSETSDGAASRDSEGTGRAGQHAVRTEQFNCPNLHGNDDTI